MSGIVGTGFGDVPERSRVFLRVFWRSRASPGSPVPAPGAPAGGGAGDPEDAAGNADVGGEGILSGEGMNSGWFVKSKVIAL